MTKIYVAFYDADNGERENWNTFYTPWVAATSREEAQRLAKAKIKERVVELIHNYYDVNLNTINIDDIEDVDMREEIRAEYNRSMNNFDIEIQHGELA